MITSMTRFLAVASLMTLSVCSDAAEDRRARVLNDRTEVQAAGKWIYNDLPQAFAEAAKTRKPMLVVFRCVP
jgi:serine protease Do